MNPQPPPPPEEIADFLTGQLAKAVDGLVTIMLALVGVKMSRANLPLTRATHRTRKRALRQLRKLDKAIDRIWKDVERHTTPEI